MPRYVLIFLLLAHVACGPGDKKGSPLALQSAEPRETIDPGSLNIPVYDFKGLQPLLHREDGTVYIVNFWATWCAPCIKELPYFEQVSSDYQDDKVQVILVSLDMPKMWESHLVPFVSERKLKSQVVVLDDPKQNSWIPLVDENWSGAIPATLIYNGEQRMFYEEPFTYESLKSALSNFKI